MDLIRLKGPPIRVFLDVSAGACTHQQKVPLQPELLLRRGAEGSDGSAHELLGVNLSQLLQNAQGGRSILILIQENLYIGNHPKVSH